ncbi:MAG: DNA-binding protein [Paenibacillaceae bacterium ZCTH02-B3]|nr:MAG: DNA-binding protein [Paenibacillaceae bacterium ZCTH02-B3]
MKEITVFGKTVDDAIESGLRQLGVGRERVTVEVLEQSSRGLFGLIGTRDAKVRLILMPDPVEEARHLLEDVLAAMNVKADVVQSEDEDGNVVFKLSGGDMGMVIGRRGQTLDALQYLLNVVANRHSKEHIRVLLDAENFRERRREALERLADRLAARVAKNRREILLEPMTPQERRIIHTRLSNHPKVRTFSKGDEPNRRVVIAPK